MKARTVPAYKRVVVCCPLGELAADSGSSQGSLRGQQQKARKLRGEACQHRRDTLCRVETALGPSLGRHRLLPECETYSLNVSPLQLPGNLGRNRDQIQGTGVDAAPVLNGEPEFEVKAGRR